MLDGFRDLINTYRLLKNTSFALLHLDYHFSWNNGTYLQRPDTMVLHMNTSLFPEALNMLNSCYNSIDLLKSWAHLCEWYKFCPDHLEVAIHSIEYPVRELLEIAPFVAAGAVGVAIVNYGPKAVFYNAPKAVLFDTPKSLLFAAKNLWNQLGADNEADEVEEQGKTKPMEFRHPQRRKLEN